MRTLFATLAFAFLMATAVPAQAGMMTDMATGLNGVVTSPGDPIMGFVDGEQVIDMGPANFLTDRVSGVLLGTVEGVCRAVRGAIDVPFAMLPWGPFSPEARFALIPGTSTATAAPAAN